MKPQDNLSFDLFRFKLSRLKWTSSISMTPRDN